MNLKKCEKCNSKKLQKYGYKQGKQRYKCNSCNYQFIYKNKPKIDQIWNDYVYGKQTYKQLAQKYNYSPKTIQRKLKSHQIKVSNKTSRSVVLIIDTTYFKQSFGVMLFKDAYTGENLLKYYVKNENNYLYLKGIDELLLQGFIIKGIVCDGRRGLIKSLSFYPIQFCQFHQVKIIQRYLSKRSKQPAVKDLWLITNLLTQVTEIQFKDFLEQWFDEYEDYYNERTLNPETGKSHYTHRRLRSAFRSLKTNLPYLFTYQKYPTLNIPNTSNKIEGSFAHLKQKLRCHNGLKLKQKMKLIDEILGC
ncbi:hypothetical protein QJU83_02495 [Pasteurella skyensis]|nr:hypothetical protein [Pasteurella skyensis]MDP8176410.1 hypothetical protein [Pasteurella skyensis]MDP8199077.1 hypothetical protein [Pasteurella skyensis]